MPTCCYHFSCIAVLEFSGTACSIGARLSRKIKPSDRAKMTQISTVQMWSNPGMASNRVSLRTL